MRGRRIIPFFNKFKNRSYKTPTPLADTIKAIPPVLIKCAIHLFSQINLKQWNTSNPYGLIVIPHWATL